MCGVEAEQHLVGQPAAHHDVPGLGVVEIKPLSDAVADQVGVRRGDVQPDALCSRRGEGGGSTSQGTGRFRVEGLA